MAKQNEQIDAFINQFEGKTKERLLELRKLISKTLPDAEERISYKMPAYYDKGYVCYFSGYENFVSLYPVHLVIDGYKDELKPYLSGKATARFSHDKPLPVDLIKHVVLSLNESAKARAAARKKK